MPMRRPAVALGVDAADAKGLLDELHTRDADLAAVAH